MSSYSVTAAKAGLPRLIDRVLAGEEVVITRHGKPMVELKVAAPPAPTAKAAIDTLERLLAHRVKLQEGAPNSVALLNLIYNEPNV